MSVLGCEIGSGFGEPGGTPSPRIPRNTPPGVRYQTAASKPLAYTPPPQVVLGGGQGGGGGVGLKNYREVLCCGAVYWLKPFSVTI